MLSGLVMGRVFLAAGATDMRKSFNSLSGVVRAQLGANPLSGDLFVFCSRNHTRLSQLGVSSPPVVRASRSTPSRF